MSALKSLAKDTAIYGLSSIVGRFLNWCLVPLHSYIFPNTMEYGKVSQLYGYVAVMMVLLTYGMETGFFRFVNGKGEDAHRVYGTSLSMLGITSLLFVAGSFVFVTPISQLLRYADTSHILMMCATVALDAFMCLPFAYLRYQKRPFRFATLKLTFIALNILFNLFFLLLCPYLMEVRTAWVDWFYSPSFGIGYIFLANLLSTVGVFLLLLPHIGEARWGIDTKLVKRMLSYSFPLLILGLAGVVNQTVVPLTYPYLFDSKADAESQMGIYSVCLKITVIITMFTQAFRYAYEPFVFARSKTKGEQESKQAYADAMKYFVLFALFAFVAVMFYLDIIQYIISEKYRVGLHLVPIAMLGEVLFGIYFNLSVWYKLTDNTRFGAYFSVFGCLLQVAINIIFVPLFGYIASAWATLVCNALLVAVSYVVGQRYYRIGYDIKSLLLYFAVAFGVYWVGMYLPVADGGWQIAFRTVLLLSVMALVVRWFVPNLLKKRA